MTDKSTHAENASSLRERAERALRKSGADVEQMPLKDVQSLVHELQVHQVELNMQNEELRSTQLELQDSRDCYTQLYELAPIGYLTLDSDGIIRTANLTAGTLFDLNRSDLISTKAARYIAAEDQGTLHKLFRKLKTSREKQTCELRVRSRGQLVWTQVEGRVHQDRLDLWLVTLTDISRRKQAEEELLELNRTLERRVTERAEELRQVRKQSQEELRKQQAQLAHVGRISCMGEMVGGIAHELNQPLHAISNFASACEFQLTQGGTNQVDKLISMNRHIAEQAVHAGEIIKRLRAFVSKSDFVRSPIIVNDTIREAAQLAESESQRHNVTVNLALADDLQNVYADKIQIEQVIVNLLCNAFESMSGAADLQTVTIRSSNLDDGVEVTVEDEGMGVPGDVASTMFDAFCSTKPNGMGLGLAISRSIIEAHGGRIWATPRLERGTMIHFTLPTRTERPIHDG